MQICSSTDHSFSVKMACLIWPRISMKKYVHICRTRSLYGRTKIHCITNFQFWLMNSRTLTTHQTSQMETLESVVCMCVIESIVYHEYGVYQVGDCTFKLQPHTLNKCAKEAALYADLVLIVSKWLTSQYRPIPHWRNVLFKDDHLWFVVPALVCFTTVILLPTVVLFFEPLLTIASNSPLINRTDLKECYNELD